MTIEPNSDINVCRRLLATLMELVRVTDNLSVLTTDVQAVPSDSSHRKMP